MKSNFILKKAKNPQQPMWGINSRLFNPAWLMMLLLSFTMWQCQKDNYKGETKGVCPEVISSVPAKSAINVVANKPITATFNETMNASTITAATFQLAQGTNPITGMKQAAVPVKGTVTPSTGEAATFTFTPESPLAPFTVYTGTMKKGVKDPLNNALQEDYSWSFTTQPQASLTANPLIGGTVSGGGIYDLGTKVTATVVPNAGYVFANWTEAGVVVSTSAIYPFEIAANRNLVANFTAQFNVIITSNPVVGGSTTGARAYNSGASVTVTAVPSVGYTFTNWNEGVNIVSPLSTYTFPISSNRTLIANFGINMYPLNINAVNGTVAKLPNQTTFSHGTSVALTANPATGYTFTSWSGDATGILNTATVIMNSEKTVTANFTAIASKFTVGLLSNPILGGTTAGDGSFNSGSSVTVGAVANPGFTFTNWTEGANIVSLNANYTFTINGDRTFLANFKSSLPLGPAPIDLGTAGDFTALTKSGVSTTGVTSVGGNIGVSPAAASAITGFGLIMDTNGASSHTPIVTGKVYASDYAAPTPAKMTTGVSDMETAFTTANNLVVPAPIVGLYAGDISGRTLPAGLYKWSTGVLITNAGVTLDGGANDVWVFQIAQNLTVNNSAIITLKGGAQAKNIFWIVTGQATLGTSTDFSGIILCKTLISLNTGARITGKLLAQTAVTLNASTVVEP